MGLKRRQRTKLLTIKMTNIINILKDFSVVLLFKWLIKMKFED